MYQIVILSKLCAYTWIGYPWEVWRLSLTVRTIFEKCADHINKGPYQLLTKDHATKIKAKTLKQLKVLKDNNFINNKLHVFFL